MNHKKFIGWIVGIPLLVVILVAVIMVSEPEPERISRAAVYKAAALLRTDRSGCEQWEKQNPSYFSAKEQNNWYVKYMDYLYGNGILSADSVPATAKSAEGWLTYGDAKRLAEALSPSMGDLVRAGKRKLDKPYPAEEWWFLYDSLRQALDEEGAIKDLDLYLYGTPANIEKSPAWTAYTSRGTFGFEGLGLDAYIDCELNVVARGGEIIAASLSDDSVVYKNVWLTRGGEGSFSAHLGAVEREFLLDKSVKDPEALYNQIADLHLKKGKLQKVSLKKKRISGKVLAVTEDWIEIENYGKLKLDKDFKVYKVYGEFKQQGLGDILVGYEIQEFAVEKGKLCAALTVREFQADTIRVLLMDTGFKSIFHQAVTLSCEGGMVLSEGDVQKEIPAGEKITIQEDDKRLEKGRLVLRPKQEGGEIAVHSIERALGVPSYRGSLELRRDGEGLVLINELYLEDYLTRVVPSEMPDSYEKEALKAQAVCARTYAYRQLMSNSYSQYGAHVDDSTRFQVYNNMRTDGKTEEAVRETYGRMLFYGGKAIEAFYFSTSCGHTTDGGVWGNDPAQVPYLKGVLLRDSRETLDLTTDAAFSAFIKDKSFPSYDSSYPLYRWEVSVTGAQLAEKIGGVGEIKNLTVTERGAGGIVKRIEVEGSEGGKTISGESQVRYRLGNTALKILKNDKKELTGWDTLPSAYIAIENRGEDENGVTSFRIYGGGYGHGAGMSQNGAQAMAKEGKDYEEILRFFYEGVEIREAKESESGSN